MKSLKPSSPTDTGGRGDYNQYGWGNDTKLVKGCVTSLTAFVSERRNQTSTYEIDLIAPCLQRRSRRASFKVGKDIGEMKALFPKT